MNIVGFVRYYPRPNPVRHAVASDLAGAGWAQCGARIGRLLREPFDPSHARACRKCAAIVRFDQSRTA